MAHDNSSKFSAPEAENKPGPSLSLPGAATPGAAKPESAESGKKSDAAKKNAVPPPLPKADTAPAAAELPPLRIARTEQAPQPEPQPELEEDDVEETTGSPSRRTARRRAAGPSRNRVAANDDGPSIGGLIFALQEKPSNAPFRFAAIASIVWGAIGCIFGLVMLASQAPVVGWIDLISRPMTFLMVTAIIVPIAVLWLLALLAWRTEELRLRSSTMTEVAIRLAEPDRLAEEQIASLGQAVRRQVSFMNDAISRALGRAGELEAMVHNEVSLLERSYEDNERKIRGLIQELSGERHALVNTSDQVYDSLHRLGGEIPGLIDKLGDQQLKLSKVIEGASENLTSLETSLASSVGNLETAVGGRTDQLQGMLENYTSGLATALGSRSDQLQIALEEQLQQLDSAFSDRTENLQTVFEEYAHALDASLSNRAEALDERLIERTKSLDDAFSERLRLFDESIMRSTAAIDTAVVEKTQALTNALEDHATRFSGTIGQQASDLDEVLMHGINSVRRASENITRQSIKAMEGLSNQSDMLRGISENLLGQIDTATGRFENQGEAIVTAANALESANSKIDHTLQHRHADLSRTLDQLSGKADEFADFVEGYSSSMEGSLSAADERARNELQRMQSQTAAESDRALEDLRHRLSSVSSTMTQELGSITDRFATTSDEMRQQAQRASSEIVAEQNRLREQLERLPVAAQESSESMRRALQDQIKALDQLSALTARNAVQRDVSPPMGGGEAPPRHSVPPPQRGPDTARSLTTISSSIAQELGNRQRPPPQPQHPQQHARTGAGRASDGREGWSLGDLLARASRDEEGAPPPPADNRQPSAPAFNLDLEAIAHGLDPATASAVWSRLRAGQRGVMVRSIYSEPGRAVFDDVTQRCRTDGNLGRAIERYLSDFERAVTESDIRDPSGQMTQSQLVSDAGRVYLFLAHASGRLG
jgi:ABC-type transporter Mla subunit MlaD